MGAMKMGEWASLEVNIYHIYLLIKLLFAVRFLIFVIVLRAQVRQ